MKVIILKNEIGDYQGDASDFDSEVQSTMAMRRNKNDREREQRMRLCGCQLCQWALNPATTLKMHDDRMALAGKFNQLGGWMPHKEVEALSKG